MTTQQDREPQEFPQQAALEQLAEYVSALAFGAESPAHRAAQEARERADEGRER